MGRRLIFGDLHGSYRALMEVLENADFNPSEDTLYSVGDIADGYPEVYECLAFLKDLPSFHPVLGNHDVWLQNWLTADEAQYIWLSQGGIRSVESCRKNILTGTEKRDLAEWIRTWPYAIVLEDAVIMHGGPGFILGDEDIERLAKTERSLVEPAPDGVNIPNRDADILLWDREYFRAVFHDGKTGKPGFRGAWSETKWLFTGHTEFGSMKPFISRKHKFVNLDTMAGSYGCLTLVDMDTHQYWQSRKSRKLYGFSTLGR